MAMNIRDIKRALTRPVYSKAGDEELREQHSQVVRQVTDIQNALVSLPPGVTVTTKGDVQGYDVAPNRIPVGANTQVLTADSTQALGLKWATPTTGTVTNIATTAPITGGPITGTGTIAVTDFVASGASHARGTVPDPGAAAGTTKFLREDATFAVPAGGATSPLTTKGDVWGFSSVDARIPVGSNGQILVADSAQTLGLKWAAESAVAHNILSATHTDSAAASPVRGDLIVANSTPAWSKLAAGSANKVLTMGASDPAWTALTNTGGGNTVTTGTEAARAAAGTAGNVHLPSDSHRVSRDNGATWDGWGPIYPYSDATLPSFTWQNQGTNTVATTFGSEELTIPNAGAVYALTLRYIAIPSAPWSITISVISSQDNNLNFFSGYLGMSDGTKFKTFGYPHSDDAFHVYNWSNSSTFTSELNTGLTIAHIIARIGGYPNFIKIVDDNTNWKYYASTNGRRFFQVNTEVRNNGLTATRVGYGGYMNSATAQNGFVELVSWKQGTT